MELQLSHSLDYDAYSKQMPGRQYAGEDVYRYGFNGQEKDDEVAGEGNSNTAHFWQYDTRLARRWNPDPKPNPAISIYACFANNPIIFTDLLGDTLGVTVTSMAKSPGGAGSQGHMALIVGNDDLGYWVVSLENPEHKVQNGNEINPMEYVKGDEIIFEAPVMKLEAKIGGTETAVLYAHREETMEDLENYIATFAPGVTNTEPGTEGNGYDRIAVLNNSTPELEEALLTYLVGLSGNPENFQYELCSDNCASYTMDVIELFFGDVIGDNSFLDRPNKEFKKISRNPSWTVTKDDKKKNDDARKKSKKSNG